MSFVLEGVITLDTSLYWECFNKHPDAEEVEFEGEKFTACKYCGGVNIDEEWNDISYIFLGFIYLSDESDDYKRLWRYMQEYRKKGYPYPEISEEKLEEIREFILDKKANNKKSS